MTLFFYIVSIANHTSVPALWKCMDTSRKIVFWLRTQPLMHHLLSLDLKDLPLIASLSGPKTWKSLGASMVDVEDTRRTDLGLLQQLNGQYGAENCHIATKHLYLEFRVVLNWLQDADDISEICMRCVVHSVLLGLVELQDYSSFIPKKS